MHNTQIEISLTLSVSGVYDRRYDTWDEIEIDDIFLSRGGKQFDLLRGVDRRSEVTQAILGNLAGGLGDEIEEYLADDFFADFLP